MLLCLSREAVAAALDCIATIEVRDGVHVEAGTALCVPGNHDVKLMRKLRGKDVQITHGLADSLEQLDKESPEFRAKLTLPSGSLMC